VDTLQTDDEILAQYYFLFGQFEAELPANWLLTLAGSYNRLLYRFVRLSDVPADSLQTRNFEAVFSPRIALLKTFNDQIAAHGSISYGFSPPSITEFRPSEGSFNTELDPEIGVNYEAGIRGSTRNNRITFDLVAYYLQLRQTIVRRVDAAGAEFFVNAGRTDQRGIELAASWLAINQPTQTLSQVKLWSTYTYNLYRYREFQRNDVDFSGNRLPGIAPNIVIVGADVLTRPGFYANLTLNFTDFIPLNDANTVYANDYALLGGRLGFRRTFANRIRADVFAGVDNALNQQYSLGNDINAFGNRYFNPAATVNYFGGINARYIF
jgi:iron complex outermembrane recepter protein